MTYNDEIGWLISGESYRPVVNHNDVTYEVVNVDLSYKIDLLSHRQFKDSMFGAKY